ncbi:RNA polymerase II C-terminal domain phosphatase-like 1 [Cucumis melo var. makuwa]|uniref:RNA polymerase II C-terminal domain phosphatase-like 1 n=1 Tax=Cucumis melo var. makuwa TaxID=1194695 RepID=A0A5A7V3K6_CUCMM|nr:RNA polymerase II C-terminal domain phosphatase-like 1 [Cucumis melo var. makuwa]
MFKQQITTFEAVLGASTQTPSSGISTTLSMYSENPITLFSNLSSTYVSGSVAQTTGFSTWEKLNGQNYFLWSQSAKMILEGQCKFGFLIGEVYRPPLVIPRNEMDLCREIVLNCPSDGIQHFGLEEVDRICDFLAGLNLKLDVVRGHILGRMPISSLMEVCFEVCLEEDRMSAMNILTTPAIDSAAFSARSYTHDSGKKCPPNDKQNSGQAYVSESIGTSQPFGLTENQNDPSLSTLGAIAQSGSSESFVSYVPCAGNKKISIADGLELGRMIGTI